MKIASLGLLLAVLFAPTGASAQVSLGLRASQAVARGDAYQQSGFGTFKQSDLATSVLQVQVDALWRFTPSISAGLYYSDGYGNTGAKLGAMCSTPGSSCEVPGLVRYGVQGAYTFKVQDPLVQPWVGLAFGLESASFKVKNFVYGFIPPATTLAADLKGTLQGWDAAVEGGIDWRASSAFVVGPFASLRIGQYRVQHVTLSDQGTVAGGGVDTAKTHQWITVGLRGRFDL